jgi:hypothetical protein
MGTERHWLRGNGGTFSEVIRLDTLLPVSQTSNKDIVTLHKLYLNKPDLKEKPDSCSSPSQPRLQLTQGGCAMFLS